MSWGTPPDPQQEVSCTSYSAVSCCLSEEQHQRTKYEVAEITSINLQLLFTSPPVPQQRELPLHSLYHAVILGGTYERIKQIGGRFGPPRHDIIGAPLFQQSLYMEQSTMMPPTLLQNREIALQLVVSHLGTVEVPLDLFILDEAIEKMVTKGFSHKLTILDDKDCFKQAPR